ncbi:hypothetical protein HMPREF1051_1466 [Neisseria sicca VK64]|uniref:Uncharacterized protein n=1 Tax=Neisseria sicca VK64 TaxID=1095748 RepID=I2NDJ7_NEISI|nr:hypothetical protein HMPREF1051_1466 [Neisseria sicca VK64]
MGGFQTTPVMQRSSEKTFVATEHWFSVCVSAACRFPFL